MNAAASADPPDTVATALAAGIAPAIKDGDTAHRREDSQIGTKFTTRHCISASQFEDEAKARAALQDRYRREHARAGGPTCGSAD